MKKTLKLSLIIITVILIFCLIFYLKTKSNTNATTTGIIVKLNEKSLTIWGTENVTGLYTLGIPSEKQNEFKPGQEVLIYFDGMVMESYPAQLGKVGKIKIINQKSDIKIPDNILRFCYSSRNNVEINVSEITSNGISFSIEDKNELPYEYKKEYTIRKKIKNNNYTGIGYKIGEDTENSTSGYTGTGLEYIWVEVEKISNISSEETIKELLIEKDNNYTIKRRTIDWTQLYGELTERRI